MMPRFVRRFLERRRFPTLLLIAATLLVINLIIPDPLPLTDEILMAIATLLIGSLTRKSKPDAQADDRSGSGS